MSCPNCYCYRCNPTRAENILEGRGCLGRAEASEVAKSIKGSLASLRGTRQISGSVERGVLRLLNDATLAPKITKSGRSFPSPEQRYSRVKLAQKMLAPLYMRGPGSRKVIHRPIEEEGKDPRLGHLFGEEYRSVAARYNPDDDFREFFDALPDIPRPEMWTPESIVQAVEDGFTFLVPFLFFQKQGTTGYYILGTQYHCTGVTVGPEHTQIVRVTPEGWLEMTLWFPPHMVHTEEAFIGPLNENGVGQVWASVDPDDIDWDSLNRGKQIRTKGNPRGWI